MQSIMIKVLFNYMMNNDTESEYNNDVALDLVEQLRIFLSYYILKNSL